MAKNQIKKQEKAIRGRPTDYRPAHVHKVWDYLKTCGREQTKLAKLVDIAYLLEVNENTITQWAKKYPDFSRAIMAVKQMQKRQLMDDSFYGGREINSNIGRFLLNVNHGLVETSRFEGEITAKPYEEMSTDNLNQIIEKRLKIKPNNEQNTY